MKHNTSKIFGLFLCFVTIGCIYSLVSAKIPPDTLLGITWGNSKVVSLNPDTGSLLMTYTQLNPKEAFTGLAYNRHTKKLYALSQVQNNLYAIDTMTLDVSLIGRLHIQGARPWKDANALTYDPVTQTLYTVILDWNSDQTNCRGQLAKIDASNAELTLIGKSIVGIVSALSYHEADRQLYGLVVARAGSWDSPDKTRIVSINPMDASVHMLFETPYHTVLGLAKQPGKNMYYSWINGTTHFYGKVNVSAQTISHLGNADKANVISAMVYTQK